MACKYERECRRLGFGEELCSVYSGNPKKCLEYGLMEIIKVDAKKEVRLINSIQEEEARISKIRDKCGRLANVQTG